MSEIEFVPFPKIARLNREVLVTEKIDGTNAQVHVSEEGAVRAGSRQRWISTESDNFGFARWVKENEEELRKLGPGLHYGEWWGQGILRGYGLKEKRWSLFNVSRWGDEAARPKCCGVVPLIAKFDTLADALGLASILNVLRETGSIAAPGFMNPEGVVLFHAASGQLFKITLEDDAEPKGVVATKKIESKRDESLDVCVTCLRTRANAGESCTYGLGHEFPKAEASLKVGKKVDKQLCVRCGLHPKNPKSMTNGCEHSYAALGEE